MAILFSTKFSIPKERLAELGVFDVLLDKDSSFFINIKRLQHCTIPEFLKSYERVNTRFREIGTLLQHSQYGNRLYCEALKKFNFSEVNGINLGFASGKHGAGFGEQLRRKIIKDAYDIIKSGCVQPEIFHLVSLFENNVGPDRLSDMVARIIYPDIVQYSKRIYTELNINATTFPHCKFKEGILINPYKHYYQLLLPECILDKLPIAYCWDEIDRVCAENAAIRSQMNEIVCNQWILMTTPQRKEYLLEQVFKNPGKAGKIVAAYKNAVADDYVIYRNPEYFTDYMISTYVLPVGDNSATSFDAAGSIIEHFKKWVEVHRGATVINGVSAKPSEKLVQLMIYGVAEMFCEKFNWDLSPETDSGRGPVDFKISRGNDKTVIEVKLSSNQECVHGLEVQIEEYAKAENTNNKIFMLVVVGNHKKRIQNVIDKHREMLEKGLSPAKLYIIDAVPKIAASKYQPVS